MARNLKSQADAPTLQSMRGIGAVAAVAWLLLYPIHSICSLTKDPKIPWQARFTLAALIVGGVFASTIALILCK